ncbi:MAG: peptide-methionine (R)-S-oxide reductase MsrB [Rhodocyclaceae bacterium]|nr:peptide-methionine (R)-S-oxide reductase MsrB [Rhodocyclaceae bacterium]
MNRRVSLKYLLGLASAPLVGTAAQAAVPPALVKAKTEWAKLLPTASYRVLFEEDTERAGSSPLNGEKRDGIFVCAACYLPLFESSKKYDSGTGWPSFFDPIADAVGTKTDYKAVWPRTEYHCARCGGHQGHVFPDGPKPTGKRYCNNGVALNFVARGDKLPELRK